jgi:hypothetical protein
METKMSQNRTRLGHRPFAAYSPAASATLAGRPRHHSPSGATGYTSLGFMNRDAITDTPRGEALNAFTADISIGIDRQPMPGDDQSTNPTRTLLASGPPPYFRRQSGASDVLSSVRDQVNTALAGNS